jgi:hypothetical protein
MKKNLLILFFCVCIGMSVQAQANNDSLYQLGQNYVTLKEVVIGSKLDVPGFIQKVQNDTSFYKAFKNLRVLGYTAINDIRMLDKNENFRATLHSKTKQKRKDGCRFMEVLDETFTGDMYDRKRNFNYYTAQLYASLFFTKGMICGETNVVGKNEFTLKDKSGMEKHKEQLKMLFFNPGKKIKGLPFMSSKTALFDDDVASNYDMAIDWEVYNNVNCFVFRQKVKPGRSGHVIVDEMTTWFDERSYDVVARNYSLSYNAGIYDFNVHMEVELTKYKEVTVPSLIRYVGDWNILFKKRERGIFTATLFDFE